MRTDHVLAEALQLAPRPGDAGERHAKLRKRQPKALGNGLELGGKLGETPGIGLGEGPPDLVGTGGAELDPIGIELAAEQTLEDHSAGQARGFGNAQQLALGVTQVACFRLDLGEEVGDPILLEIEACDFAGCLGQELVEALPRRTRQLLAPGESRDALLDQPRDVLAQHANGVEARQKVGLGDAGDLRRASLIIDLGVGLGVGVGPGAARRAIDDMADAKRPLAHGFAPSADALNHHGNAGQPRQQLVLGCIDALRERQLLFAGEQLRLSDVAEIDIERIAVEAGIARGGPRRRCRDARERRLRLPRGSGLSRARDGRTVGLRFKLIVPQRIHSRLAPLRSGGVARRQNQRGLASKASE